MLVSVPNNTSFEDERSSNILLAESGLPYLVSNALPGMHCICNSCTVENPFRVNKASG